MLFYFLLYQACDYAVVMTYCSLYYGCKIHITLSGFPVKFVLYDELGSTSSLFSRLVNPCQRVIVLLFFERSFTSPMIFDSARFLAVFSLIGL